VGFASLCGKIDSIAHLKRQARELSDEAQELAKKVSMQHVLTDCLD
jgi:hypothetical protein